MELLNLEKSAVSLDNWKTSNRQSGLELRTVLMDEGLVIQGLQLFLTCIKHLPDEQVTIGLTVETSMGPKCFARVDWRATNGHINVEQICGKFQFLDAGRSHFHSPNLIDPAQIAMDHIRENLPIAETIHPPPADFSSLLVLCAKLMNVSNLTKTVIPPWQL